MKSLLQKIECCLASTKDCCEAIGKCLNWFFCCGWCPNSAATPVSRVVPQSNVTQIPVHSLSEINIHAVSADMEVRAQSRDLKLGMEVLGAENKITAEVDEQEKFLSAPKRTEIDLHKITATIVVNDPAKEEHNMSVCDNVTSSHQIGEIILFVDQRNFTQAELQSLYNEYYKMKISVVADFERFKQAQVEREPKAVIDPLDVRTASSASLSNQNQSVLTFTNGVGTGLASGSPNAPNPRISFAPGVLATGVLDAQMRANTDDRTFEELSELRRFKATLDKQVIFGGQASRQQPEGKK